MAPKTNQEKQQARELIERLGPNQVSVVIGLLEALLDPVSRAIANALKDDEPESDLGRRDVAAESGAWFERQGGLGIPQCRVGPLVGGSGFTPIKWLPLQFWCHCWLKRKHPCFLAHWVTSP